MIFRRNGLKTIATLLTLWLVAASQLAAQPSDAGTFQLLPDFGTLRNGSTPPGSEIEVRAKFEVVPHSHRGQLSITATMARNWHVYSLTQPAGGPLPTQILLQPSEQFRISGGFLPDRPPQVKKVEVFAVPVEEHSDQVTWTAPVEFAANVDPQTVEMRGQLDGLVCSDQGGCVPLSGRPGTMFTATFAGFLESAAAPGGKPDGTAGVAAGSRSGSAAAQPAALAAADANALAERAVGRGTKPDGLHAKLHAVLSSSVVRPGELFQLHITAIPDAGWHIYAYETQKISQYICSTLVHLSEPSTWSMSQARASEPPHVDPPLLAGEPPTEFHERPVTWTFQLQVPADAPSGQYTIKPLIAVQTCATSCDIPTGLAFVGRLQVGDVSNPAPLDMTLSTDAPGYEAIAKLVSAAATPGPLASPGPGRPSAGLENSAPADGTASTGFDPGKLVVQRQSYSLPWILGISLIGGFILNFMPCVLPVIGLKIMSFAEQAGQNRRRVMVLNLWYSLGMLAIFWVLATLASAASLGLASRSLGWGEQFNYDGFNIPLAAIVFVMGLSFLGVWEMPIPGFASSSAANQLATKEGASGAFFKGVITTILATPCSGPALTTALAWSAGKPPVQVYLVFTMIGIGMALPYVLIGAFPHLIRYLPKPGAWMETFKQIMGFVLLGTVVYLMTFIAWPLVLPTWMLLVGLGAGCWWIGRVPYTAEWRKRAQAWSVAALLAVVVGLCAFGDHFNLGGRTWYGLRGTMEARFAKAVDAEVSKQGEKLAAVVAERRSSGESYELPWEPYSFARLSQLTSAGKTVLLDFTANWCLTCKSLEIGVLNTKPVRQKVEQHQVVTLVADWGDRNPQIGDLLEQLGGSRQIPLLAIFPADRPNHPIVLNTYTTGQLLEALDKAGPSRPSGDGGQRIAKSR